LRYDIDLELTNKQESYSFHEAARQANGAAWLRSGNTVMLATVVVDETEVVEDDFLPLTVQYIEKTYAAGKIPGGFFKRETKPSDFETLTSRIVDRSLRPIFPKGFGYPTQITVMVLSVDKEADLQVLALNAASAALFVSDIDISRSVSAVRVAKIDGEIKFNPAISELSRSTFDLYLSGTQEDILMIEMCSMGSSDLIASPMIDPLLDPILISQTMQTHSSNAMPEDELIEIIERSQAVLKESNTLYSQEFQPFCKEVNPLALSSHTIDEEMVLYISNTYLADIKAAIAQMAKSERSIALRSLRKKILETKSDWCELALKNAIEKVKRDVVRSMIIKEGVRADGRTLSEVRPITIDTNILPSAHASCLFTRGQTQALVALTLGGPKDAQMYENLTDEGTQNESFMVHYNFPGFAVGEASPIGAPRRRELGHGNLAKRALEPILNLNNDTIRLVSEILESNGSSSMATVCGGYMALRAADIQTSDMIAGIAMGMVSEGDKHVILSDIMGLEDHDGDMDFKVTGSKDGITAMQMDIKLGGISLEVLKQALYQAKEGRCHILDIMEQAAEAIELNEGVLPVSHIFHVEPGIIGSIIGQAGKTIREIIEKFDVAVDIDKKSGQVKLLGTDKSKMEDAKEHIQTIASSAQQSKVEYKIGDIVEGKVKKIVDFGAFIELDGSVDGLLHISKLSDSKVQNVSDVLHEGQSVKVEILEFKGSKIGLGLAK
jgi:polyribonucleotide nucleotidyltransferase